MDDDASPMSSRMCMLRPTWMFMDRIIAPIDVHSISQKLFTKHDSRNFFPWHHGIITSLVMSLPMYEGGISIETYSAGAGRDVASIVDNEHLKCTATLLKCTATYYEGLILTKLWWFLFSRYGQTDRQTRFWNPHMETCRHTKNIQVKTQN